MIHNLCSSIAALGNGANGSVDLTVSGGTPGYSFNWTGGSSNEDPTGLSAGIYFVTVTDANGCSLTQVFEITQPNPIIGTTTLEAVQLFANDPETKAIVMIGEIGGDLEIQAAKWIKANCKKPVIGFIAGETAPKGRTMGHAGAIVSGADESAAAKKKVMRECGIHVVDSPATIGAKVKEVLG